MVSIRFKDDFGTSAAIILRSTAVMFFPSGGAITFLTVSYFSFEYFSVLLWG